MGIRDPRIARPGTDWSELVRDLEIFLGPGPVRSFKFFAGLGQTWSEIWKFLSVRFGPRFRISRSRSGPVLFLNSAPGPGAFPSVDPWWGQKRMKKWAFKVQRLSLKLWLTIKNLLQRNRNSLRLNWLADQRTNERADVIFKSFLETWSHQKWPWSNKRSNWRYFGWNFGCWR